MEEKCRFLEMVLPIGETCSTYIHFSRCESIYGALFTDEVCDWYPSKYVKKDK